MENRGNDGKSCFSSSRKRKHSDHRKGFNKALEGERLALISLTSRKGRDLDKVMSVIGISAEITNRELKSRIQTTAYFVWLKLYFFDGIISNKNLDFWLS